jgi:hypothetical protein
MHGGASSRLYSWLCPTNINSNRLRGEKERIEGRSILQAEWPHLQQAKRPYYTCTLRCIILVMHPKDLIFATLITLLQLEGLPI